jgi:GNAT superfamily N-acetyltransferase
MQVRAVNLADCDSLALLMSQLGYPTTPAQMAERLEAVQENSEYGSFVGEMGGRVVGMIGLRVGHLYELSGAYGQIMVLVVAEDMRNRGIGKLLIEAGEDWLKSQGAGFVMLTSARTRPDAHRFYERLGYQSTGIRLTKTLSVPGAL